MNNELGNTIKKNRIRLGMSQTDLSKITGVDTKTISLIERGIRRKPTPETLIKLASVLDCVDINVIYNIFGDNYDCRKISLKYFIDLFKSNF